MKIRQGFVSNSSSSSFCIYGANCYEGTELFEALKKAAIEKIKKDDDPDFDEDGFCDDPSGAIESLPLSGLSVHYHYDNDDIYIGRDCTSIKDDETGRQFKDSVIRKLAEATGLSQETIAKECGFHEECWANY